MVCLLNLYEDIRQFLYHLEHLLSPPPALPSMPPIPEFSSCNQILSPSKSRQRTLAIAAAHPVSASENEQLAWAVRASKLEQQRLERNKRKQAFQLATGTPLNRSQYWQQWESSAPKTEGLRGGRKRSKSSYGSQLGSEYSSNSDGDGPTSRHACMCISSSRFGSASASLSASVYVVHPCMH